MRSVLGRRQTVSLCVMVETMRSVVAVVGHFVVSAWTLSDGESVCNGRDDEVSGGGGSFCGQCLDAVRR